MDYPQFNSIQHAQVFVGLSPIQFNPTRSDLCWTIPNSIQSNTLRSLLDYRLFNPIQHAQSLLLDCPLFNQIQHAQILLDWPQSNPTRSDLCWTVLYSIQSNTLRSLLDYPQFNSIQHAQIFVGLSPIQSNPTRSVFVVGLSPIQSNPTRSDFVRLASIQFNTLSLCWTVLYSIQSNTLSLCWTIPKSYSIQHAQSCVGLSPIQVQSNTLILVLD